MTPRNAWPGRVFLWKDRGYRSSGETLYVALSTWDKKTELGPRLRVLVLSTTYPYHTAGEVMTLRTDDRMWMEAERYL